MSELSFHWIVARIHGAWSQRMAYASGLFANFVAARLYRDWRVIAGTREEVAQRVRAMNGEAQDG